MKSKEITADNQITKFYIYNTEGDIVEVIDSVDKAFEFLENEGRYVVKEKKDG